MRWPPAPPMRWPPAPPMRWALLSFLTLPLLPPDHRQTHRQPVFLHTHFNLLSLRSPGADVTAPTRRGYDV
eukprot:6200631-Pleurochrysis_carterae.AAC.1